MEPKEQMSEGHKGWNKKESQQRREKEIERKSKICLNFLKNNLYVQSKSHSKDYLLKDKNHTNIFQVRNY